MSLAAFPFFSLQASMILSPCLITGWRQRNPPLPVSACSPLRCHLQAVSDTAEHDAQSALMAITGLRAGSHFQGRYTMDAGQHRGGASIVSFAKQSQAPFLPVSCCSHCACSNMEGPASSALQRKTRCLSRRRASAVLLECCVQHCAGVTAPSALLSRAGCPSTGPGCSACMRAAACPSHGLHRHVVGVSSSALQGHARGELLAQQSGSLPGPT